MKIIVAPDSMKGCLSAPEVAAAIAEGVRRAAPQAEVVQIPVADGGEGFTAALARALCTIPVDCAAVDPLGRTIQTSYAITADQSTAIIDLATASGLTLLKPEERNPLKATTFGTGLMIADAISRRCRRVVLGIGGSATVDGGAGLLRALGFRFNSTDPARITVVDDSAVPEAVRQTAFIVACDVDAPLCGPRGAAQVFGPQKGADAAMVAHLDRALARFAAVTAASGRPDVTYLPGAGAAGGVGGAMVAYLGARLHRGIDVVLDAARFDDRLRGADLVFTAEGKLDAQTLMGKAPAGVLHRCRAAGVPVVALAGAVNDREALLKAGFTAALSINPVELPLAEAMRPATAAANLATAAAKTLGSL